MKDLAGGDARLNASILEDVFGGARGAVADALVLNAGVALAACEVAGSPQEGVAMAQVRSHHDTLQCLCQRALQLRCDAPSLSSCPHLCRLGCLTPARAWVETCHVYAKACMATGSSKASLLTCS